MVMTYDVYVKSTVSSEFKIKKKKYYQTILIYLFPN